MKKAEKRKLLDLAFEEFLKKIYPEGMPEKEGLDLVLYKKIEQEIASTKIQLAPNYSGELRVVDGSNYIYAGETFDIVGYQPPLDEWEKEQGVYHYEISLKGTQWESEGETTMIPASEVQLFRIKKH